MVFPHILEGWGHPSHSVQNLLSVVSLESWTSGWTPNEVCLNITGFPYQSVPFWWITQKHIKDAKYEKISLILGIFPRTTNWYNNHRSIDPNKHQLKYPMSSLLSLPWPHAKHKSFNGQKHFGHPYPTPNKQENQPY
jgi:hypothetical protein